MGGREISQLNTLLDSVGVDMRKRIMELYSTFTRELDRTISRDGRPRLLYDAARQILGRGKMLRPLLVLLVNDVYRGSEEKAIKLALAVELLHTSSLIHDDIIDGADTRRGVESVHKRFGVESAIVAGDYLIATSIKMASDLGPRVIRWISEAAQRMGEGEVMELSHQGQNIDIKGYFEITERKTASLLEAATASSAYLAQAPEEEIEAFRNFGRLTGLSLQIRDDILDVIGDEDVVGKPLKRDYSRGRFNIVYVLSRERGLDPVDDVERNGALGEAQRIGEKLALQAIQHLDFLDREDRAVFDRVAELIARRMI